MTDKKENNPTFQIVGIYTKDSSFEAPLPISSYKDAKWQPSANVDVKTTDSNLEDKLYEIVLHVNLTVTLEDKTVFIVEMQQAGTFIIDGIDGEKLDHVLKAYCPSIVFPYIRQNVSEMINKAGFPPLYLSPIDFESQYMAKKEKSN